MRTKARKKRKISLFKIFYIGVLGVLVVMVLLQEWKIHQVKAATSAAQLRVAALQQQQEALKQENADLQTPKYIEKVARTEYKMIKPNEIPIVIIDKEKK